MATKQKIIAFQWDHEEGLIVLTDQGKIYCRTYCQNGTVIWIEWPSPALPDL